MIATDPQPRRTLRLLYVSHSFPLPGDPLSNVGGMQRVAVGLYEALAARADVEMHPLLLETSWEATHRRMPLFMAGLLRGLPRVVRERRIEAVLFSSMVTASALALRGRAVHAAGAVTAAIPVGRDVTLPVAPYQWLVPRVMRQLDLVLPISRATADECIARGAARERTHVVPCGADPAAFPAPGDRGAARRELLAALGLEGRVPDGALLLCSVGRHQRRKGFHWFVERVMPLLPPGVHYLLAGAGPMTEEIRAAVALHGLGERVHLLGQIPEETLLRLYRGADLFVMPNVPVPGDIEGFGVVMLEAGLSGLPTVAAELEGIADVVREGENGHLLPSGDAEAFAARIRRYAEDRAGLREASARASRFTVETFSWGRVAERHVELLRGAVRSAKVRKYESTKVRQP